MTTTITLARNPAYEDDDSEDLVSKATWPLKLSGLLFAGMLVIGRSATYGNITWAPAHHEASAPLVVVVHATDQSTPSPSAPKSVPLTDPGALGKRSAADEVVTFSPGSNSGDDEDNRVPSTLKAKNDQKEKDGDRDKDHEEKTVLRAAQVNKSTVGEADNATANSPHETVNETNSQETGQATVTANTGNTNHETANETPGDATAEATATAQTNGQGNGNTGGPNNNGPTNAQGNQQANVQVLSGTQAAWFGRTEETPWPAVAAVGGLMTLIGLAFLKPWRFLRKFIR